VLVPDTKYVMAPDGVYLAYQVVGDGPIDVALGFHYFGSNVDLMWDEPDWRPFMVAFAEEARLILHDRRGLGVSSRNVAPPNLETQAADLLTVLDAAGSERPILASGSVSSAVHVLFAATHPDRVSGLIWNNPTARVAWAPDYPWGETFEEYEQSQHRRASLWGTSGQARSIADFRARERLSTVQSDAGPMEHRPELVNSYAKIIRNSASPDVAQEIHRINYETDVRAVLPLVRAPAVLITGKKENVEETRYIGSLMPNATVHVIEGRSGLALEPILRAFRTIAGIGGPIALDTVLATVLFTDIVGSTERQAAIGDRAWKDLVQHHHAIVRSSLQRWRGVERDTAGDGFFATFDGPARGIRCAAEIVEGVREIGLAVRAGVHIGECEIIDGGIGGLAVTIGARISAQANASKVLISQTVKELVAGSGFNYEDAGERELKGVPGTWRLWAVSSPGQGYSPLSQAPRAG
jgi:class 3 adenylate cyclase/pimeloyl-ACP methyl ester carboxylesterase